MIAWLAAAAIAAGPGDPVPTEARVREVYDGDTVTLETGEKARLQGVNAPERRPAEPFAEAARRLVDDLIGGRRVTLVVGDPPRDAYGRILARIHRDDVDVSTALLRAGLAHVFWVAPPPDGGATLLAAQAEARAARRGLWGHPAFEPSLRITSFHPNAPGDDHAAPEGEYLRLCNLTTAPVSLEGWSVRGRHTRDLPLPAVTLPPGRTITVHSGSSTDQRDPASPLAASLGTPGPVWDDDGERLQLLDPSGRTVQVRETGTAR